MASMGGSVPQLINSFWGLSFLCEGFFVWSSASGHLSRKICTIDIYRISLFAFLLH